VFNAVAVDARSSIQERDRESGKAREMTLLAAEINKNKKNTHQS